MEVETVHLVPRERIDGPEDILLRVPLSSDIQVQPAVLEFRLVDNRDGREFRVHSAFVLLRIVEQLRH